jgi:hypothetical protein
MLFSGAGFLGGFSSGQLMEYGGYRGGMTQESKIETCNRILEDLSKGTPDSWKLWGYSRQTKQMVRDLEQESNASIIEEVETTAAAVELVASKSKMREYGSVLSGSIASGMFSFSNVQVFSGWGILQSGSLGFYGKPKPRPSGSPI